MQHKIKVSGNVKERLHNMGRLRKWETIPRGKNNENDGREKFRYRGQEYSRTDERQQLSNSEIPVKNKQNE